MTLDELLQMLQGNEPLKLKLDRNLTPLKPVLPAGKVPLQLQLMRLQSDPDNPLNLPVVPPSWPQRGMTGVRG